MATASGIRVTFPREVQQDVADFTEEQKVPPPK